MTRLTQLFLLSLALLASPIGQAASNTYEYTLNNGLKLIVRPDHRAPVVMSMIWYKVGSAYEPAGITGISHMLEHMMFKGTKHYKPGQFSTIISANGGRENAMTYYDFTAYYQKLSKDKLPLSFKLEADRMRNLTIDPKLFAKEKQVVIEERRMRTDDNPTGLLFERMKAAAHLSSPYHHPIIGWKSDMEQYTKADADAWYHRYYAPNNAIIVVVGDVKPLKVKALAEHYFATLPKSIIPTLKPQTPPRRLGEKDVTLSLPAKVPSLIMAYNTPSLVTAKQQWKPYALEVLASVLDGGGSARFEKNLVRGQKVLAQVSVSYDFISKFSGLMTISAVPAGQHSLSDARQAITAQLNIVKSQPVSPQELERIKRQVIAQNVFKKDSLMGQTMEIGMLESVGLSWQVGDDYSQRIAAVTPQQIQAVAKEYLLQNNVTVAKLIPQTKG